MDKHISSQFDAELTGVSSRVLELGGLVESQTRHALQRFMEWLDQTGEADILARRAASRAKIVRVIAAEYQGRY